MIIDLASIEISNSERSSTAILGFEVLSIEISMLRK